MLLSCMGAKTYELCKTIVAPVKPSAKTYAELVDELRKHLCPKPIVIAERFNFYTRKQKSGETVTDYLRELKKLAESCKFDAFLKEVLRDVFVIGLEDKAAQCELLSEAELTIEKAFQIAHSREMAAKRVDEMHVAPNEKTVHKVAPKLKPCWRCGKNNHEPDKCYFKNTECFKCRKIGHIGKMCPGESQSRRKEPQRKYGKKGKKPSTVPVKYAATSKYGAEEESDESSENDWQKEESMYHIRSSGTYTVSNGTQEIIVEMQIEGKPTKMEVDTGAGVSIMSLKKFEELSLTETCVQKTKAKLKSYTGEKLQTLGVCYVNVSYEGSRCKKLPLYIVKDDGPTLLGREWLYKIRLNWHKIFKVEQVAREVKIDNQKLKAAVKDFKEIFDGTHGKAANIKVQLQVKEDAKPIFYKPRPVPYALRQGVEDELKRLVEIGVLEKVDFSDWAAPVVPVRKANGDIRICGDFKVTINQHIQSPEHPMPRAEELYNKLNGGKKFSKLDLEHAYQQLELDESSRKYVTINTHLGLFRYTRLPYGIACAPQVFQSYMDQVLQGVKCGCHTDDIIVTGADDEEHVNNLVNVFQRLKENGLKCNWDKCKFLRPSLKFLSYMVDCEGVRMTDDAIEAIRDAPRPTCRAEMQSFMGLVNHYRQFVPDMSTIASPLTDLLKNKAWDWSPACEEAFLRVRSLLSSRTGVLVHYDPQKPVILAVDASPVGLGAVISHITDKGEQPIAYGSRTLTQAERNYAQIEREGLAVMFGLKKFHQMLFGRRFTIVTDNKPLSYIFGPKRGIPLLAAARVQRWAIQLAAYSYDIQVRSSKQNLIADYLSRQPQKTSDSGSSGWTEAATSLNRVQVHTLPIKAAMIARETRNNPVLSKVLYLTRNGWPEAEDLHTDLQPYYNRRNEISIEEGCLLWGLRTIIPEKFRDTLLRELHESHPGIIRMKALARLHVWWPLIDAEIEAMVKTCKTCQDLLPKAPKSVGNPWKWPSKPWRRIHVDFAGPFMGENFLILVDAHSKWPEVHQMSSTTTSKTIEALRQSFAQHGLPAQVVSDNGPQFTADEFKQFLERNGIEHIRSPAYHPSTNGEAERFVRTFKKAMKAADPKDTWNKRICNFLLAYRTTPHSTTNVTPAEAIGRKLCTKLDAVHPNLGERIERKNSAPHDKPAARYLEVGDLTLTRDYRQRKETWVKGVVIKRLGPLTYLVQVGDLVWKRHVDQLRLTHVDTGVGLSTKLYKNMDMAGLSPRWKDGQNSRPSTPDPDAADRANMESVEPDQCISDNELPTECTENTRDAAPGARTSTPVVSQQTENEQSVVRASLQVNRRQSAVPTQLRRSNRSRKAPERLKDYDRQY